MKIAGGALLNTGEVLLFNQTFGFFNRHNLIRTDTGHGIDNAAGPTHFDEVDCGLLLEAETQPQITSRMKRYKSIWSIIVIHQTNKATPSSWNESDFHSRRNLCTFSA